MDTLGDMLAKSFPEIISNLVVPIIIAIFTPILNEIRLQYFNSQGKNRYIKLLRSNCSNVEEIAQIIKRFKRINRFYSVYILLLGLFIGGLFSLSFLVICFKSKQISSFIDNLMLTNISDFSELYYAVIFLMLLPVLINLMVYLICHTLIKTKFPLTENDNYSCKLKNSQILSYLSFWLSIGFIIGPYIIGIIFIYILLKDYHHIPNISWTSNDIFSLFFTIILFILIVSLCLNFLFDLLLKIKQFPEKVIDPIIDNPQNNFPVLKLKTRLGRSKGQLKHFQNEYIVISSEENTLTFIYWDEIEAMEIIGLNKNKYSVPNDMIEKKSSIKKVVTGTLIVLILLVGFCKIYLANSSYIEIYSLLNSSRYEDALQTSIKAIDKNPNNADAWNAKGDALYRLGKYNDSIKAYDKAIEIIPYKRNYYKNKADSLLKLGRYDKALQVYNKSIDIDPDYAKTWSDKGLVLYNLGRYDEALQAYNKSIDIDHNNAEAWSNKGNMLFKLGRYDEALQAYNKSIDINPNYTETWNNKGAALTNLGRYDEALQAYNKSIDINPNFVEAWSNKGKMLFKLGRYDEALQAYNKSIDINPNFAEARNNNGAALNNLGRYDEALQN